MKAIVGASVRSLLAVSSVCVLQGHVNSFRHSVLHVCMHYWLHCGHTSSNKRNFELHVTVSEVPLFFVVSIYSPAYPLGVPHTWNLFPLPVAPAVILSGSTLDRSQYLTDRLPLIVCKLRLLLRVYIFLSTT